MVAVTIDAQRVLDRLQLAETDIAKAKVEPLLDDAIATVSLEMMSLQLGLPRRWKRTENS